MKIKIKRVEQKIYQENIKFAELFKEDLDKTFAEIEQIEDEQVIEQKLNDLLKRHELDDESIQKVIHSSKTENKKPDKKSSPFLD